MSCNVCDVPFKEEMEYKEYKKSYASTTNIGIIKHFRDEDGKDHVQLCRDCHKKNKEGDNAKPTDIYTA